LRWCIRIEHEPEHLNRSGDVFHLLLAEIVEAVLDAVLNLIAHTPRDADPPGRSQPLQPRSDVNVVAEDAPISDHDITDIDPDAKLHSAFRCKRGVRFRKGLLNGNPAVNGINNASELSEHTITRAPDYMSTSSRYEAIDDGAMSGQGGKRRFFILMHEATVALNVCCKDGSKLPFGRWCCNEGEFVSSMRVAVTETRTKGTQRKSSASTDSKQ
jgi:hypothetical protein